MAETECTGGATGAGEIWVSTYSHGSGSVNVVPEGGVRCYELGPLLLLHFEECIRVEGLGFFVKGLGFFAFYYF